jgi:hypothetical protein
MFTFSSASTPVINARHTPAADNNVRVQNGENVELMAVVEI